MTNKIKQSILAQRQLPEHIRENYPLFVEFIKSYYDFLQQTQAQELEKIRDIDTTLDEFIDNFKSELAKNFPIHLASDKAKILKHLKEFYLSRGSEESFKFLFNVLFSKEAELFYPSTQILRASDGKWYQDVSIFVTPDDPNNKPNISELIGKFITITNSKQKQIYTYIENVVEYSDTICEVFIQRDYLNEIDVGAKVECIDGNYSGTILACPSKVKIYKGGKGFKAGDIYALKTQLGRGCVIKITKVDSEGSIKNIKVIRFGLDYKTKFYSYLSSKELSAFEYVHPLKLNQTYNPADPTYKEYSGGFVDSGWASKQTYFYYDPNIPVKPSLDPSHASDRYYADTSYVGDVVEQFYADDSQNPIDKDLAIIEIELGAVAKYPGYYLRADGFISDESYIHDGNYYQAFSYVIKVEEELRKYSDIVKSLIHPAGMKLFSEYRIFNLLKVSATSRKFVSTLQLPLEDHPPSEVFPTQRGYGYNNYKTEKYGAQEINGASVLINAGYITYPDPIADLEYPGSNGVIISQQGKAAKHIGKGFETSLDPIEDFNDKLVNKPILDYITERLIVASTNDVSYTIRRNYDETITKVVSKPLADTITNYIETLAKSYTKKLDDSVIQLESLSKFVESAKQDIQLIIDSYAKLVSKPISDSIQSITDQNIKLIDKSLYENVLNQDSLVNLIESAKQDVQTIIDTYNNLVGKPISDSIQSITDDEIKLVEKNISDSISNADSFNKSYTKYFIDEILLLESKVSDVSKNIQDIISGISDADDIVYSKNLNEVLNQLDSIMLSYSRQIDDLISLTDRYEFFYSMGPIQDYISIATEELSSAISRVVQSTVSINDALSIIKVILLGDSFTVADIKSASFATQFADTYSIVDNGSTNSLETKKIEAINISTTGRLRLAPYDQEGYFVVYEDYQPAIAIQ